MTSGNAKAVVTVSMVWLGVLIIASRDWVSLVKSDISAKAGSGGDVTHAVSPQPSSAPTPIGTWGQPSTATEHASPSAPRPNVVTQIAPIGGSLITQTTRAVGGFLQWIVDGVKGVFGR
jgi:hypothetical protein